MVLIGGYDSLGGNNTKRQTEFASATGNVVQTFGLQDDTT